MGPTSQEVPHLVANHLEQSKLSVKEHTDKSSHSLHLDGT